MWKHELTLRAYMVYISKLEFVTIVENADFTGNTIP